MDKRVKIEAQLTDNYHELQGLVTEYVGRVLCRKPIEGGDMVSRAVFSKVERLDGDVEVQLLARFRIPNGMLKEKLE